jgi:hypothetical protein
VGGPASENLHVHNYKTTTRAFSALKTGIFQRILWEGGSGELGAWTEIGMRSTSSERSVMVGGVGHGNRPKTGAVEEVFSEFTVWMWGALPQIRVLAAMTLAVGGGSRGWFRPEKTGRSIRRPETRRA